MTTPNPMASTYPSAPRAISKETHCIAGILTTVYGLQELPEEIQEVACLWLLHPRLQTQACMEPIASSTIHEWNERQRATKRKDRTIGLIAVSFDQRNHGTREVDTLANEAWRSGNSRHAQDMFASYRPSSIQLPLPVLFPANISTTDGTAIDTSHLLTYLPSYIPLNITQHLVLGISLGGHAAWHCLLHDPRITTAIIIIGCPDYVRLMSDRARLSKLPTWTKSSPSGSSFLGSADFPTALISAVEKYDPAGLLLGDVKSRPDSIYNHSPTALERRSLLPLLKTTLQNKRILNLAGGSDKLVPYKCSEPFLHWLKAATAPITGWFKDGNVVLEDMVFDGVGHEMSAGMVKEVHRFVCQTLDQPSPPELGRKRSKI